MYQKIIELLRIHGYMKNDTETGPCYVKNINGRNKCVFVIFDKKQKKLLSSFLKKICIIWKTMQGSCLVWIVLY